jgi:hypothetical protein
MVVVIIAVTPAAFWLFTMWDVMSNADSYTESLDDEAYEELAVLTLPLVAELVADAESGDESNQAELFADVITNIDHDEWKTIIGESIDPVWVKDLINRNLNNGLQFFRYETDEIDISVDFTPVVAAISQDQGDLLVENMIDAVRSWEDCSQDERLQMATYLDGLSNTFPNCNPGGEYLDTIETQLGIGTVVIENKLEEYPNLEFDLRNEVKVDRRQHANADELFSEMRQGFFFIENTRPVMLLFPVMLFGLVVVFAVRSAKEFFLWGGIILILTGVFTLLPLVPWIYGLLGGPNDAPRFLFNRTEYELSFRLQRLLFEAFAQPIIIEVGAMLLIGFVFLVLAGSLRGTTKATETPVYYVMSGGSTPQPMYPMGQYVQTTTPPPAPTPIPVQREAPPPTEAPSTPSGTVVSTSGTPSPMPTVATSETPPLSESVRTEEEMLSPPESFASEHIRGAVGRLGVDDPVADHDNDMTFVPMSDELADDVEADDGDNGKGEDE